jgi:hypothetical protein
MARTTVATPTQTSPQQEVLPGAAPPGWPQGLPGQLATVRPPLDARQEAGFIAARVAVARRPPALALLLATGAPHRPVGAADKLLQDPLSTLDLGPVSALTPDLLAWHVIELSQRLMARPEVASHPGARGGLGTLMLQARMFQHLHILQSAASEGVA